MEKPRGSISRCPKVLLGTGRLKGGVKKKGPDKSPLGLVVPGEGRALSEQVEKEAEKWSRGELMETRSVYPSFQRKGMDIKKSRKRAHFLFSMQDCHRFL